MKSLLIANGCSHTAGFEIEKQSTVCKEEAWPSQLAKKLKIRQFNLAKPGSSNNEIIRRTTDWIVNNVVSSRNYKPEQLMIMTMWSGYDRTEVMYPNNDGTLNFNSVGYSTLASSLGSDVEESGVKNVMNYNKSRILLHDNLHTDYNALRQIYFFTIWLESLGIKNYNINGIYSLPGHEYIPQAYNNNPLNSSYINLLRLMGRERRKEFYAFSDHDLNYFGYYYHKGPMNPSCLKPKHQFKISPVSKSHFGKDVHIDFANKLYDFYFSEHITEEVKLHKESNWKY